MPMAASFDSTTIELMFCNRLWNRIAEETGIEGIDFRACRRTCATHLSKHGGIKEVQAHLRHSRATTTLDVYVQEIPEAVREAVESLDSVFAGAKTETEANKTK
jgi:integrase